MISLNAKNEPRSGSMGFGAKPRITREGRSTRFVCSGRMKPLRDTVGGGRLSQTICVNPES